MQHRLSKTERNELPKMYQSGMSCTNLANHYGVSTAAIYGLLKRRGVVFRNASESQKKCQLDESVFDIITPESAYWAGFLFADGTIIERGGSPEVALVLSERDREHVVNFQKFLGSSHKILDVKPQIKSKRKTKTAVRLCVRSIQIASALKRFGFAKHLGSIAIPELANCRHFWRGVIDGDGCIGFMSGNKSHCARIELVGGFPLLSQFVDFIHNNFPKSKVSIRPHKTIFRAGMSCTPAKKLIEILYTDSPISLKRKLNAAINILAQATAGAAESNACGDSVRPVELLAQ
jgi:hypothetical protein